MIVDERSEKNSVIYPNKLKITEFNFNFSNLSF